MAPGDFRPWIDEAQAKNADQTPDEFAASQAALWEKGLGGWGLSGTDIANLRAKTDFTIYTPGSQSGVALNIVGSLQVPADLSDAEIVGDEIEGYVTGLLGLVNIDADPLSSREHILISNLINNSWQSGKAIDLMTLIGQVAAPPIRKLGVFDIDQFFPESDRMALAIKLNGLLASPSFAAWGQGAPLDIQSMLYSPDGEPRCAIITTAHLSDTERQFVTSLVLSKLVTWMRAQSGTTDLRAMLYMDEVAGYLPPTANPPTKKPIMTLMKQARAFGVGVVLSTQNPVDIDYKANLECGNMDDWSAPDRSRQSTPARRDVVCCGRCRHPGSWRHHLGPRQTRVHAAPRRQGRSRGFYNSLGDVVPAWSNDARSDPTNTQQRTGGHVIPGSGPRHQNRRCRPGCCFQAGTWRRRVGNHA